MLSTPRRHRASLLTVLSLVGVSAVMATAFPTIAAFAWGVSVLFGLIALVLAVERWRG